MLETQDQSVVTSPLDEPLTRSPLGRGPVTVVVVGQTPPPVNGQTLMIQSFLRGQYQHLRLVHVPMHFSRSADEVGNFSPRKVLHLFNTLFRIAAARFRTKASVLYYPPAGANLVPVLRDFVLLISSRWLFRRTAFHFHAAGLCKIYERLPWLLRPFFHMAYNKPDLAIFTTLATSADAKQLRANSSVIIPCGIEDRAESGILDSAFDGDAQSILFAGILCEEKGVLNLLEACRLLKQSGTPFQLTCLGGFSSESFRQQVKTLLEDSDLTAHVFFPGVVTGDEKDRYFRQAAIFCFPSHYPAESFGVVLIEAMSFSLPIVATDWQGIPEVLGRPPASNTLTLPGSTLVPIKNSVALADALRMLLEKPDARRSMGLNNRTRYQDYFTVHQYRDSLEKALVTVAS